jgi:hypothetical protein
MTAAVRGLLCLLFLASLSLVRPGHADDPQPAAVDANVIARFEVASDGDCLLLPVTFKGNTYRFLLDTGATYNFFDPSLSLGGATETIELETPAGLTKTKVIPAPEATVDNLSLRTAEPAIVQDLSRFRQVGGDDIRGVVGMSFLGRHVVRIDFDRGEVLFLKSAPADSGDSLPLAYERGSPVVVGELPGWGKEIFCIDTGDIGRDAGNLTPPTVDGLVKTGVVRVVGSSLYESVAGTSTQRVSRVKSLQLGAISCTNALFGESRITSLGLGFLSRFVLTFDFPHNTLYLKKGKRFDQPYAHDRSGLHILRQDGKTVVHSLDKGSPAETAGFKAGDVLVQVGEVKAEQTSMFQLRGLFHRESRDLPVRVRRGEKETVLTLDLRARELPPK